MTDVQESEIFEIFDNVTDYKCRVGVLYLGGAGSNILRSTMDYLDPTTYPDFNLLGADTDSRVHQRHFGKRDEPHQKAWQDAKALRIHQLGGKEVTQGQGAGGNPEVGRQATETDGSMNALRKFMEANEELILVGAVGGGTGTGSLPVAARLAREMGKSTVALVVMPDPEDGLTEKALPALQEIESLVPVNVFQNSYLPQWMKCTGMSEEDQLRMTYEDGWKIINEHSIVPMIMIMREIIQETGDVSNIDAADWRTGFKDGYRFLFGWMNIEEPAKVYELAAQAIVDRLFAAHFQDPKIIDNGNVILFWAHGPWPMKLFNQVRSMVRNRVLAGDPTGQKKVEVHKGLLHHTSDGKMWITFVTVQKRKVEGDVQQGSVLDATPTANPGASRISREEQLQVMKEVSYHVNGKRVTQMVPNALYDDFRRVYYPSGSNPTLPELQAVLYAVQQQTNQRPDLPEWAKSPSTPVRVMGNGRG